jgi:UDP-glucose 4-epimerase
LIKKILVTGGAGFIGSHLCQRLSKNKSYKVYSLDNYSTGVKENHVPNVTYITGETRDIRAVVKFSPDYIYHLGEYSRVEQSFEDIEKVWRYNKDGIFAVLQFCRSSGAKIIYAGSSTKYGDGGTGKSQSPYAWTKSSNTELVVNYGKWFDVPYAITYFYNVYGEREISEGKYATLIALFIRKYMKGEKLSVVSPGTQKRNFTYIDDIIDGIVLVGEKGNGDEYGIGHQHAYSILEIAEMFNSEIEILPERKGNRMTADVITSKTEALGWSAKASVSEYIKKIIEEKSN